MRTSALVLAACVCCGGGKPAVVSPESPPAPVPAAAAEAPTANGPPAAAVRPVDQTYHGVTVSDPYQWLEQDGDPEVVAWSQAQNAHARAVLDALPELPAVTAQLEALKLKQPASYGLVRFRAGKVFAAKHTPPKEQATIVVFDDGEALTGERVVLDPTTLDAEGLVEFDWFEPSPDGKLVAVSLSRAGSERGDLHVYDVATGKPLADTIEYVQGGTAGGSLAWLADGSGFFYTRYPRAGERPEEERAFYQQLWLHRLGTPVGSDTHELGRALPADLARIAEMQAALNPRTGELLVRVAHGDGGEVAYFLRSAKGGWRQLSEPGDGIQAIYFGAGHDLYLISRAGAPRGKLLRLARSSLPVRAARVVIPEGSEAIVAQLGPDQHDLVVANRLHLVYQLGGPTELRAFSLKGKRLADPPQLQNASIGAVKPFYGGGELLYYQTSYVSPGAYYRFDPASGRVAELTQLKSPPAADLSDAEVLREMATSKDGTQIPLTIIRRRGSAKPGPCIATGYGGYGISLSPYFNPSLRLDLDRDVCHVIANLRGGAEFGEAWHKAGMLTHKQNVFDDFAAVLQHLVERGYTTPRQLGIIGGSNGGLLMGAMITQHPELFRAAVSAVGIYDQLRVELTPNGRFNVTEYGTVEDADQFAAMYAYSPYHHVGEGTAYPAVLFTTGDNDPRVAPWHSRKMTARLQAATTSGEPILLRTSARSGHGSGNLSEAIAAAAHTYAFLYHQIGAKPAP